MNLNELTEYLKNKNVTAWYPNQSHEYPYLCAYILPNLAPEKYSEYEQDYAKMVNDLKKCDIEYPCPYDDELGLNKDEKGVLRVQCWDNGKLGNNIISNGVYAEIGCWESALSTEELIAYLRRVEMMFTLIDKFNRTVCQKCEKDYVSYGMYKCDSDRQYGYHLFDMELFLLGDYEKGEMMLGLDVALMPDNQDLYDGRLKFFIFEDGIESYDGTMVNYFGYVTDVTIPEYITEISAQAFLDKDVERITIPDGVKCHVSAYAFEHCDSLKYVYFGSDVEVPQGHYEGDNLCDGPDTIFYCCDALERIEVSPDNPYISSEDGKLYNKDKTKLLYDPADKSWWEED